MGLFTKRGSIPVGDEALTWANHRGDLETGTYVGWISQHSGEVADVARQIGWAGQEMSEPFAVEVTWDASGPKGGGYKVTAAGKTLGYTSRAVGPHTQTGKRVARLFVGDMGQACLLLDP
jgi:hypothetical protein